MSAIVTRGLSTGVIGWIVTAGFGAYGTPAAGPTGLITPYVLHVLVAPRALMLVAVAPDVLAINTQSPDTLTLDTQAPGLASITL